VNLESVEELREHKGNSKIVALIRFFTPLLLSSMFFTKEIAKHHAHPSPWMQDMPSQEADLLFQLLL